MKIFRPLDALHAKETKAVLWLNSPGKHSPIWKSIWNTASLRICTDGAANSLESLVRDDEYSLPTLISGDFDSINERSRNYFKSRGVKLQETPDQDHTDMCKALLIIAQEVNRQPDLINEVIILGGLTGRFDHTMASLHSMLKFISICKCQTVLVDSTNLVMIIEQGSNEIRFDGDRSMMTSVCGIIPFCQRKTIVTTRGFKWNIDQFDLEFGKLVSSSNEIVSDVVSIETSTPLVFTMQLTDDAVQLRNSESSMSVSSISSL